jgi:hypothetical protein
MNGGSVNSRGTTVVFEYKPYFSEVFEAAIPQFLTRILDCVIALPNKYRMADLDRRRLALSKIDDADFSWIHVR